MSTISVYNSKDTTTDCLTVISIITVVSYSINDLAFKQWYTPFTNQ